MFKKSLTAKFLLKSTEIMDMDRKKYGECLSTSPSYPTAQHWKSSFKKSLELGSLTLNLTMFAVI